MCIASIVMAAMILVVGTSSIIVLLLHCRRHFGLIITDLPCATARSGAIDAIAIETKLVQTFGVANEAIMLAPVFGELASEQIALHEECIWSGDDGS